jgi:tetratricopeptide (TPR) repeat protein
MLIYWARMARGGGNLLEGTFNQALVDFDAIMKFRADIQAVWLIPTYQHRGHAYFRSGRYLEAVDDYTQVLALLPEKLPDVYKGLGLSYYYLGKNELALQNLQIAARLGDVDAQSFLRALGAGW